MFRAFEKQFIDQYALRVAEEASATAFDTARKARATLPEAVALANDVKGSTYKTLTGTVFPGLNREATTMKKLTTYEAVGLAEGFIEGSEDERIQAWQQLINTGLAFKLQGSFGRTAMSLIETGICNAPTNQEGK
jgi:hypothetical protein